MRFVAGGFDLANGSTNPIRPFCYWLTVVAATFKGWFVLTNPFSDLQSGFPTSILILAIVIKLAVDAYLIVGRNSTVKLLLLADWPLPRRPVSVAHVKLPQREAELAALHRSVKRACPYGHQRWTECMARRLGMQSTFAPRGRTEKQKVVSDALLTPLFLVPLPTFTGDTFLKG